MSTIAASHPQTGRPTTVAGAFAGALSIIIGLTLAYLVVATPLVAAMVPTGADPVPGIALAIWLFALVAGLAFLVSGTDRLAAGLAWIRRGPRPVTPVLRAELAEPSNVAVITDVVPNEGRPIPELVIGPFGMAVVHELAPRATLRRMGDGWETLTPDGWRPSEDPRDRLVRDAERVRRWLAHGELEFVVRVYAALVVPDASLARTPTCAVIMEEQIPAWLAALPPQRSLSPARRERLAVMARAARPGGAVVPH